jgi:hypothetical protein
MNIAVVDLGGNLVSHIRMDGAWLGSIDISINKAFTARAFDISTAELAQNSQPGQQFLWNSCFQPRAGDDLRRRYTAPPQRIDHRRDWGKRGRRYPG